MDELEGKDVVNKEKSFKSVNKVFTLLLSVCSDEAFNLLEDLNEKFKAAGEGSSSIDLTDIKLSGALSILQNLQKQLLGRAALFNRTPLKELEKNRKEGVSNPIAGFSGPMGSGGSDQTSYHLAMQTLVGHAEGCLHACA
eukprot:515443-Amorphochlora_amoeboformis.AAC.1